MGNLAGMWYLYTMEFYSAIQWNKILPFVTALMNLEDIMLGAISQTRQTPHDFTYMWNLKKKVN